MPIVYQRNTLYRKVVDKNMTELLFSDEAKHYLFAGRNPQETYLFTVTPSEVNVILRVQVPGVMMDSMLLIQGTKIGEGGTLILKPLVIPQTQDEAPNPRTVVMEFIDDIITKTDQIQSYATNRNEQPFESLDYLKNNLLTAKNNLSGLEE